MKKIIIIAAVFLSTGILASCTKHVTENHTATVEPITALTKKDIGTAD